MRELGKGIRGEAPGSRSEGAWECDPGRKVTRELAIANTDYTLKLSFQNSLQMFSFKRW